MTVNTLGGYTSTMTTKTLQNRMKRLAGQLEKLQVDIDNEKDCGDVIPQFLAVKGALAGAYEEYIKIALDSCAQADEARMKRLIKMLVKA